MDALIILLVDLDLDFGVLVVDVPHVFDCELRCCTPECHIYRFEWLYFVDCVVVADAERDR